MSKHNSLDLHLWWTRVWQFWRTIEKERWPLEKRKLFWPLLQYQNRHNINNNSSQKRSILISQSKRHEVWTTPKWRVRHPQSARPWYVHLTLFTELNNLGEFSPFANHNLPIFKDELMSHTKALDKRREKNRYLWIQIILKVDRTSVNFIHHWASTSWWCWFGKSIVIFFASLLAKY